MSERSSSALRQSFRVRACDNCRLRKIKCDKAIPCSSCGALGIPCKQAGVAPANPEPSRRSSAAPYEQKLDTLQEQLSSIQQTLQQLTQPSVNPVVSHPTITSAQLAPPFEGQSSFHHESLLAKDAVISAVGTSQKEGMDDNVSAALLSLKDRLDRHQDPPGEQKSPVESSSAPSRETLLPVELVVAVVKKVQAQPPFFLVSQTWRELLQVEILCQSIYFPIRPIAAGSLTLLHGLLYYIMRDFAHERPAELAHYDLLSSANFCGQQFSLGLNSHEMMVNPTLEKIQALLVGVMKAQEEFDLQHCWAYLSLASNMCQAMGLHRSATLTGDTSSIAESKRHAFWALYTVDKNISLNMGMTSHFQDHDIDADPITPSNDARFRPWDLMSLVTVEFAAIQGRVYDELYSVAASRASDQLRLASIEKLSSDLIAVRDKLLAIDVSQGLYAESLHGMAACADFITYSVLTVIYRAQTRPHDAMAISSQCYETAALALNSHLKCFTYFRDRQTHKQTEYVNWILLYPSFAPFVIVFTHAITSSSTSDLTLLQDTVKSLDLIKGLSRGSMHLYTICEAFAKTAQVLVGSRKTLTGLEQHQDGSLFMPVSLDGSTNIALPDFPWPEDTFDSTMDQEDISLFLNDFIGTNRSVMGILNSNYMNDPSLP
ncbi:hypothetical protein FE257_003354 [Aspergillus nanangensis]|uniref:Zn(2)-C6 fungal-type domain-containing protein n=1 Tax=Aspergillus nanangensis TaxID=2582783 RepID=A0AAD4GVM4_ASPNN|nr:hypothetical protein FE257_003354 [Aspergillus nanangensis]